MRLILVAALALTVAACSKREEASSALMAENRTAPAAEAEMVPAAAGAAAPTPPSAVSPVPQPAMIAYEYRYGLSAPQDKVRGLIARHEALCRAAGERTCQVIGANVAEQGGGLNAQLVLKAAPSWVAQFRGGLAADVAKSDGRIVTSGVESEDLSREIIDTGARLRAQTALRDRLVALLATRPGKLADLIELEQELARVQGEIDSAQSQLNHAQGRVATSTVTLAYESRDVLARDNIWSPLGSALGDFLGLMVGVIAVVIRVAAVLLPLGLLGGLGAWIFRKPLGQIRERRRAEQAEKQSQNKAPAP